MRQRRASRGGSDFAFIRTYPPCFLPRLSHLPSEHLPGLPYSRLLDPALE